MTTPLIMLGLLMVPFGALYLLSRVTDRPLDRMQAAAISLGIVFVFTGIGHFIRTEPMSEMLPAWVPHQTVIIYATGFLEFALAGALFTSKFRLRAAWACIAVLILFFPANIYAAINHTGMGGHTWGPVYLLIRGPLQLILISWAYFLIIRPAR